MSAVWDFADFDDHEHVHMFRDRVSGLTAVIAVHSTHLGPGAGGVRYWHYPQRAAAITDALRLSRGMSYKNAMAGLPMGGGKGVILAADGAAKTPELLAAFGRAVTSLGGAYVTAEAKIGRERCRERVWKAWQIRLSSVTLKKNNLKK